MSTSAPTRRSTRRRSMELAAPVARRAVEPTSSTVPHAAGASLARVASTVELLAVALDDDVDFFAGLLRRGMLDASVEHAILAASAPGVDADLAARIERTVVAPLLDARRATAVADAEPRRLATALDGALTAARALVATR